MLNDNQAPVKMCRKCGTAKPVSAFYRCRRSVDGLQSWCKTCDSTHSTMRRKRVHYAPRSSGTKTCSKCHTQKPVREFYGHALCRDGLNSWCKQCVLHNQSHCREINVTQPEDIADLRSQYRIKSNRRRALKRGNGGTHTAADIRRQGESQRWQCWWRGPGCAVDCRDNYEVDHLVPLSKGGHNGPSNLVVSCPHCNRSKQDKLPEEWIGKLL